MSFEFHHFQFLLRAEMRQKSGKVVGKICTKYDIRAIIVVMSEGISELEIAGISEEDLRSLTLDDGSQPSRENILEAEINMPQVDKRRQKTLTFGHKAKILQDYKKGMSQTDICKKHDISRTSFVSILNDPAFQDIMNPVYISGTKKMMANRFYQLADVCLNHIDFQKLERLDPYKLGVLASIALDKARLIEGQSTENLSFKNIGLSIVANLDQLKERKANLLSMLSDSQKKTAIEVEQTH
jgi:hypothetical protein